MFAKFVVDADDEIILGNDVMIVNRKDELFGIGKALMPKEEMLTFRRRMAIKIKIREGVS